MRSMMGVVLCCAYALTSVHAAARAKVSKTHKAALKMKLSPMQYRVTQEEGTEPPFQNAYWNETRPGIYVDVISGEALFSSVHKFKSGTGWPSFWKPLERKNIITRDDNRLAIGRVEVRSKKSNAHLGHLFNDGPEPTGLRYCMNSASLRFIPAEELEQHGYSKYMDQFALTPGTAVETATLAGGCFWGVEELIRKLPGVISTEVGYTGGLTSEPHYADVARGDSGHAEAVQVKFDPRRLSYADLLSYYFRLHDPTTVNQQGNDRGTQYRSVIFYHTETQRQVAEEVRQAVDKSGKWAAPVVTQIVSASVFTRAENQHQDYLQKNPAGYTCHFLR